MIAGEFIACLAVAIFNLIDLKEHNKKVDQTWPDYSDQRQSDMRLRFTLHFGGEYILIILLAGLFIKHLLEEIL